MLITKSGVNDSNEGKGGEITAQTICQCLARCRDRFRVPQELCKVLWPQTGEKECQKVNKQCDIYIP